MLKRDEVEILLKADHPKTEVARLSGVSLRSVKRIAQEMPVVHVDDKAERNKRQIGRPSTVQNFRKQVVGILQETPELASLEILRQVREAGYQGGETARYDVVASLRPKSAKPLVAFRRVTRRVQPARFWGSRNGACEWHSPTDPFFASRLEYSRYLRVLERGRFIRLDGPSGRTRHLNLEEVLPATIGRARIFGNRVPQFPEPTIIMRSGANRGRTPWTKTWKLSGNRVVRIQSCLPDTFFFSLTAVVDSSFESKCQSKHTVDRLNPQLA